MHSATVIRCTTSVGQMLRPSLKLIGLPPCVSQPASFVHQGPTRNKSSGTTTCNTSTAAASPTRRRQRTAGTPPPAA